MGNIFPLNTKFSDAIGYTYTDENGKQKPVFIGSYGIGTTRALGVLVEKYHDEKGMIWPKQVAPFDAHLIDLRLQTVDGRKKAEEFYNQPQKKKIKQIYIQSMLTSGEILMNLINSMTSKSQKKEI